MRRYFVDVFPRVLPVDSRGFTLIELLLITSVVGILTTIGAGLYRDYSVTKRVLLAADEVANLMNVAKARAISQVKPASCGNSELDGYRVVACPGGAADKSSYQLEVFCGGIGRLVGQKSSLPANTTFGCSAAQAVLFRTLSGASDSSGSITISSGGKTKTISVDKAGLIAMSGLTSTLAAAGSPSLSFSPSATSVAWGDSVTLSWSTTGVDSCTASGGWEGVKAPSGSEIVGPLSTSSTFTITCQGLSGSLSPQSVNVTVNPPVSPTITSFTAESTLLPPVNTGTALHWTTTGSITDCTASGGTGNWTGSQPYPSGDFTTGSLPSTTTYTLTCTGPLGSNQKQVTVTVSSTGLTPTPTPIPVLTFKGSTVIAQGSAVILSWTSSNLDSCSGNSVAGDSTWSTQSTYLANSHTTPPITTSTTYTLNCLAGGTSVPASAVLTPIAGSVYTAFASPDTKTADSTAGVKRTILRSYNAFTLKGFGFYVENGTGSYSWAVYDPNTSTLKASGTTGAIPDSQGYYYANLGAGVAIPTNESYVYLDVTFPNASSGTARYATSWQDFASTNLVVVNSWNRNTLGTGGGYAIKIIY